jgi:hypothetical protein
MAKTGINYKESTGEIDSVVTVSRDSDLALNKRVGMKLIEVTAGHPCINKPEEYEIKSGKVKKKTVSKIAKEKKDRLDKRKVV